MSKKICKIVDLFIKMGYNRLKVAKYLQLYHLEVSVCFTSKCKTFAYLVNEQYFNLRPQRYKLSSKTCTYKNTITIKP